MRRLRFALALIAALAGTSLAMPAFGAPTAASLATEAKQAFDGGQFDRAAALLEKAYALQPAPPLLFNLGRAYLQGGHLEKAVEAYRRYLQAAPDSSDANAVRGTVRELDARIAREAKLREDAQRESARAEREAEEKRAAQTAAEKERAQRRGPGPIPWVIGGVGMAAAAAALPLWLVGSSAHSDAVRDPDLASAESSQSRAQSFATASTVALIVGGVLITTAVAWLVFDARARSSGSTPNAAFVGGPRF